VPFKIILKLEIRPKTFLDVEFTACCSKKSMPLVYIGLSHFQENSSSVVALGFLTNKFTSSNAFHCSVICLWGSRGDIVQPCAPFR